MKSSRRDFLQTVGAAIVVSRFGGGCSGDDPDREPDVTYDLTVEWVKTTMNSYIGKKPTDAKDPT